MTRQLHLKQPMLGHLFCSFDFTQNEQGNSIRTFWVSRKYRQLIYTCIYLALSHVFLFFYFVLLGYCCLPMQSCVSFTYNSTLTKCLQLICISYLSKAEISSLAVDPNYPISHREKTENERSTEKLYLYVQSFENILRNMFGCNIYLTEAPKS